MSNYAENALVRGLTFLAEKQASIANNLANVDTVSFKRRAAMAQTTGDRFHSMLDRKLAGVDYVERSDMRQGSLRQTGSNFDVAVQGNQWFHVRDAAGREFYTRNGQFQIGPDGSLSNRSGMQVLGREGNPIKIGAGDQAPGDLTVSPNGTVADPTTGQVFGTLAMVELPEPDALVPVGNSLFVDPHKQRGTQATDGLQQGFVEGSNVDSLQELVAMITVERSFSATQQVLSGVGRLQQNMISQMLR